MNNFYVSSIAFQNKNIEQIVEICLTHKFNLEFSSNLPYSKNNMELFESFGRKKLIHNYFPAPKLPFVINLASTNQDILKQSIEHCKQNILRTSKLKLPFYAVHAGFCLDPQIVDLEKKIISKEKINRKINMEIFMESLKELLEYSNKNNVELCIENNVISKENYESNYYQNIFLCTDYNEIKNIIDEFKHMNLGILLDTGHLKVSSMTLNLDLNYQAQNILKYTRAIHHSDNDGLTDLNSKIDHSYWFLPFMKDLNVVDHVVEVKNIIPKQVLNQIQILKDGI